MDFNFNFLVESPVGENFLNELDIRDAIEDGLEEATALLLNRVRARYLRQENAEGVAWEPSLASFRRSFGIGRKGGGTLFDTGNLFHSIQVYKGINPLEYAIGTDVPYGKTHQFGEGKHPVREFLGWNQADATLARNVLAKKINEALES